MSFKDRLSGIAGSIKDTYNRAEDIAKDAASSIESTVSDTKESVKGNVNSTLCSIESTYDSATNTVMDGVEAVQGAVDTVKSGIKFVSDTAAAIAVMTAALAQVGVIIAAIVAPVPTAIGMAIMLVLVSSLEHAADKLEKSAKKKAHEKSQKLGKRQIESALKLLKKYGKIPETATFGNDFISMTVSAKSGTATGKILKGEYKGVELSDLDLDTLNHLLEKSSDDDTSKILDMYIQYREKSEMLNG